MKSPRAIAIIPAYNEAPRLPKVIAGVRAHAPGLDVLVIDDGSGDETARVARECGVRVISHAYNAGYGVTIQTGLKYALREGYPFAVTIDGDGQHEPRCIEALLACCESGRADLVIGSRYLDAATRYRGTRVRAAGARFFGRIASAMIGAPLTDPTSGFLAMNRAAMARYTADEFPDTYPDANAVVLCHQAGLRIIEHPVTMYPSPPGKRSMHDGLGPVRYVFEMLLDLGLIGLKGRRRP